MRPSASRRGLLGGLLIISLGAFKNPDHGEDRAPDHPDDARWAAFRGVRVTTDTRKGVATAVFPPDLLRAQNQVTEIGGYMIPLEAKSDSRHFLLTRRSSGCPFCPPNEANEAIEVFAAQPVHYEQRQVFIKGRLTLVSSSDNGLFFQLREATAS
jgi:hypothetical protein